MVLSEVASDADETGDFAIYSIEPGENARFRRGEWGAMKESLTPAGHVPVNEVEFDETTGYTIRTLGLERFAKTSA